MGTKRFFLAFTILQLFTLFSSSAQSTIHGEFPFDIISEKNEVKTLIAGYDRIATDGIDTIFGEAALPPYAQGQYDARFRLPDLETTTYRDFRVGCNYFAAANYVVEWVNSQTVTFSCSHLSNFVTYVKFIDMAKDTVLALYWSPDSIHFHTAAPLNQIKISVLYVMALSPPHYHFVFPQGGEVFQAGSVIDIKFDPSLSYPNARNDLFFSPDSGASWEYIGATPTQFDSIYSWTVPAINSSKCKIRVGDYPCVYAENSGTFTVSTTVPVETDITTKKSFDLSQNYPNPFNPVTTINYSVPEFGMVNISVFDILGRKVQTVVNQVQNAGEYSVPFDASNLSGGIYYYWITTSENSMTRKMVLLK